MNPRDESVQDSVSDGSDEALLNNVLLDVTADVEQQASTDSDRANNCDSGASSSCDGGGCDSGGCYC